MTVVSIVRCQVEVSATS